MSDTIKHKIKEQTKTIKGTDNAEYVIKVEKITTINYPDTKKDGESSDEVAIKIKRKDEKDFKDAKIRPNYTSGWFLPGSTIPKDSEIKLTDGTTVVTTKDPIDLDVKGFELGFYISGVVLVLILAGLGYWWYTSSKNEENEEEAGL